MRWLAAMLAVAVVAGCAAAPVPFQGSGFAACPRPAAGGKLPAVTVTCMDGSGQTVSLDRLTGRPMVVNLWASWCAPCGQEMPAFQRLHSKARDNLVVLGVATKDDPTRSVQAAQDVGIRFANVFDPNAAVERGLGRANLPVTVFVDAKGAVTYLYAGPVLTDKALADLVKRYLGVVVG
ncbi:TlpA family protein disulfide reductase [Fodinicola acaciae]|uniref:TlpA family protein disulfide reductase n=1 Tax=Fodinicola acaciae TaxID=2681555 RepID=UPI0013D43840|nr:TlpA disulfide reductase family protein [Fodinicola acaciae]